MLGPGRAWRERVSIDMSDSTYIRKHWRLELRRHEDVSESLAAWIEAVTNQVTALGSEGSRTSLTRMPPHTFAFFLLEAVRIARASRSASDDPRAEDLTEARRILRWDDVQTAMRTHAARLTPDDLAAVQSLLTHAAPAASASVTGRVRKSSEWRFVEEMDAPDSFVRWLETVAEELEADPSVREQYGRPGSTLPVLVAAVSIAGLLYVVQRPVHKAARADFQETVAMLRKNPIWMETMRRHAGMLTESWYPDALEGLRLAVAGTKPPRA
jgi:hypothetical protein